MGNRNIRRSTAKSREMPGIFGDFKSGHCVSFTSSAMLGMF